ncbi:hypothetical protein BamIOP4010DRAFT_4362 [Burkholderia ambifaria IOP40-10]|uniref:Uncharacterized protein n=1 Tax=Burkholderia ambifaria IOP40-10 TaxID=396596 RepID=B1FK01_9BURK|nr:hypothetical protein BamIOP4010DRAFT_4362 [Burkholderia ambifaria IOP40-10]
MTLQWMQWEGIAAGLTASIKKRVAMVTLEQLGGMPVLCMWRAERIREIPIHL